jgi:hypothetical protein
MKRNMMPMLAAASDADLAFGHPALGETAFPIEPEPTQVTSYPVKRHKHFVEPTEGR